MGYITALVTLDGVADVITATVHEQYLDVPYSRRHRRGIYQAVGNQLEIALLLNTWEEDGRLLDSEDPLTVAATEIIQWTAANAPTFILYGVNVLDDDGLVVLILKSNGENHARHKRH